MKLLLTLLTLLILLLPSAAFAADPYFTAETISPMLITPPLVVEGAAWKGEIAHILDLQAHADPKQVEQAAAERNLTPEMVATALPELTRDTHPAVYHLLDRVAKTAHGVTDDAKDFWHTKRPYLMDKRVKPLIEAHDNPAYPSGHTSTSATEARVLCLLYPQQCALFLDRAKQIAEHRVLVGMHYPHDVAGGQELALLIVGALLQTIEFREDVAAAQQELEEIKK